MGNIIIDTTQTLNMISCVIRHQRQNCINLLIEYNLLRSFDMFKKRTQNKEQYKEDNYNKKYKLL